MNPEPLFHTLRDAADFERFIGEFTNYERMREYRYAGDTLSLERMAELARELGHPQASCPSIHVAGTKGKGTTCLMVEALLLASGHTVGTYTSPHIQHLSERIRRAGEPIAGDRLCALANSILPVLRARWALGPASFPTFFELMTALAMLEFARQRVDWAIFEVGLGGRLDATNVVRPRWTAITSIGLEHTDKLGDSLALIAREKAGILKPSTPVVLGELPPEAEEAVLATARERGAPVIRADLSVVRRAGPGLIQVGGPALGGCTGPLPEGAVRGPALRADLCLAIELWRGALRDAGRSPRPQHLRAALERLRLPARAEVFPGDPPAVIDGAHTRESVRALALTLEEIAFPRPRFLVFSLAADKPVEAILREASAIAEEAVFTRADPIRGRAPEELARAFEAVSGRRGAAVEDPEEAFALATGGGHPVVVSGSFYLAGRLRPLVARK